MTRPNLLLFMPDELRADSLGAFGNPVAGTPHLDALAARGTRWTEAYSQHSVCSQSRVSLFTGWYPHVAGHRTLDNLLKPWEPNLLRTLREAGYYVAWAGIRGDTFAPGVTKASTDLHGFAVAPTMFYGSSPYPREHPLSRAFYHGRRDTDGAVVDLDEACVQTAEKWLGAGLPEPWALVCALIFPHPPFEVEEPWFSLHDRRDMPAPLGLPEAGAPRYMSEIRARYGLDRLDAAAWAEIRATYYGMVSRVDDHLGRVLRAVERAGAAERTVTAFCTDHGDYLGDYGLVEKWPSGLHSCLLRNPLVLAGPGVPEGEERGDLVELIDLFATLVELAGTEPRHTHFGRSLLTGAPRDAAFSEGGFSVAEEPLLERADYPYDLKAGLQHEAPETVGRAVALRTGRWTYVYRLYEGDELYDRATDPGELRNLSGSPEVAPIERELRDRILRWTVETADAVPWDPDPRVSLD
jgi:arylsulfatase A-like enzyme